jgi:hypothetical protein
MSTQPAITPLTRRVPPAEQNTRIGARDSGTVAGKAAPRAVIWAVGGGSQQFRYGLLNGRLFCIFIHRYLWANVRI